jgi:cell division initiation protein
MKITPLEIRQKTFEKKLRGYDRDEVNAFLLTLSQEWERIIDENKEYKFKLTASDKEVQKLREVESSLFKTLKTAEDTGANMIEQANKTAELHLRETQMTADGILNEAKTKARNMIEEADDASRKILDDMERQVHELHHIYRNIENHKDSLISEIRHLAQESLERIEKISRNTKSVDLDSQLKNLKRSNEPNLAKKTKKDVKREEEPVSEKPVITPPVKEKAPQSGSFFDEIE